MSGFPSRRYRVAAGGHAAERYEIQHHMLAGWENCTTDNDGNVVVYDTKAEAQANLDDHIASSVAAVAAGSLVDFDPAEWRIAPVGYYGDDLPEGEPAADAETTRPRVRRRRKRLKPWNEKRAAWARAAVDVFKLVVRTDEEDALCDLLCDLMHLADREGWDFVSQHRRALYHYEAEQLEE